MSGKLIFNDFNEGKTHLANKELLWPFMRTLKVLTSLRIHTVCAVLISVFLNIEIKLQ